MALALRGTPAQVAAGSTYTPEAAVSGDRLLVFAVIGEASTGATYAIPSVTHGGVAATRITESYAGNNSATNTQIVSLHYIKEADIVDGAQTLGVTWDQTMNGSATYVGCYTLDGYTDQTAVFSGYTILDSFGQTSTTPWTSGSVDADSGSILIGGWCTGTTTSSPSYSSGWTEDFKVNDGVLYSAASFKNTTASGSTNIVTTFGAGKYGALSFVEFVDAGGGGAPTVYPQNRGRLIGTGTIGQGNGFGYKRF